MPVISQENEDLKSRIVFSIDFCTGDFLMISRRRLLSVMQFSLYDAASRLLPAHSQSRNESHVRPLALHEEGEDGAHGGATWP